jgi:sporulation protein YlmC with PRC-barrel domain
LAKFHATEVYAVGCLFKAGQLKAETDKMRTFLMATTAVVALSSAAWAASDNAANNTNNQSNLRVRQELTQMLQKSGYTDIRVAPTSFMVRAKDQDGNPVMMSISPDHFTELTAMNDEDRSGTNKTSNTVGSNNSSDRYVTVPSNDDLSSKLVGLDVYNKDNKDIGTIKDIALNSNGRASAYIVSVGGFLGMGEHYVAVNPEAVNVSYKDNKWHADMNATADQLKAAPEFKYSGRWASSKM